MQQIITVTVPPEAEPLTLAEAKTHLRIDHETEDDLIRFWIRSAREYAESYTGRRYVEQTLTVKLDEFPSGDAICLDMFGPNDVQSLTIAYLDDDGDSQTLNSSNYELIAAHNPPLVVLTPDGEWPTTELDRYYPVTLTVVVGKNPPDTPPMVREAMLLTLTYWDENRGGAPMETSVSRGMPAGALRLLDMNWTGGYP